MGQSQSGGHVPVTDANILNCFEQSAIILEVLSQTCWFLPTLVDMGQCFVPILYITPLRLTNNLSNANS